MNGVAVSLTPDEASRVTRLPGVASVRASRVFALETYRGPEFIGADSVWNGSAVPGGIGNRGQGVVVGDIDTGINSVHPSFADDATCGFGSTNHKLLSAADCSTTDTNGLCNGPDPEADPGNGHGVHTASTAVGNTLDGSASPPPTIPPPHTFMSGVAPCAHLRTYKVCTLDAGCTDAALTAGIENAIADRVDVANFSIGPNCGSLPGDSPWSDGDEIWLDALGADVFVAAAAGNTRPGCNDPGGRVSNISPWVATIAASTHDENVSGDGSMSATGPGVPPANTIGTLLLPGSGLDTGQPMSGTPIRYYADNPIGCTVNGGFPPSYFAGGVALIERGNCTYEEKIDNAQEAGAVLAVIYNNQDGYISMGVGGATLPAYSILQADGLAYVGFIDASAPTPVTVDFVPATRQGDVLASFSLRGPDVLTTITKPDLTGARHKHLRGARFCGEQLRLFHRHVDVDAAHRRGRRAAALGSPGMVAIGGQVSIDADGGYERHARRHDDAVDARRCRRRSCRICRRRRSPGSSSMKRIRTTSPPIRRTAVIRRR